MPKGPKGQKRPSDLNRLAASIVGATTEGEPEAVEKEKNPAAVALGKLGGKKGGAARAKKLSARRRKEIAQLAARARWSQKGG